jgi:hypothetical protein
MPQTVRHLSSTVWGTTSYRIEAGAYLDEYVVAAEAAAMCRKQIAEGLDGDSRAAAKARVLLRDLLGPITLSNDESGQVRADYKTESRRPLGQARDNWSG